MSNKRLIFTLFAKDRPGIVESVSDVLLEHQANWQESSLSRLCGQFAGILHIDVQANKAVALRESLAGLAKEGIEITSRDEDFLADEQVVNAVQLVIEANDRPGIIKEIAEALAKENINVDNIDTEVESASMAGYPIFRAHFFLAMPDDISEDDLEAILENISDDLMVSIVEQ